MPDTDPPATTRRRGARRPGDATTTTTAVAVQTVTEHDPARLDQRITAIEGHLVEQDRHLAGQDLSMEARTVQVDAQFRQLRDGQAQLLGIIQALPPIPKGDAEYLHALAAEWPHDRVDARTSQMHTIWIFVQKLVPLVPMVERLVEERTEKDKRDADVAAALVISDERRRADTLHLWTTVHTVVTTIMAGTVSVTFAVLGGTLIYLFTNHKITGTILALLLVCLVLAGAAVQLFVSRKLREAGPHPAAPATIPAAAPATATPAP